MNYASKISIGLIIAVWVSTSNVFGHQNKKNQHGDAVLLVKNFYELAINQHRPKEAADKYIGNQYIQHNPNLPDGKQAFIDFFTERFNKFPNIHGEIKRSLSDGDLVVLHVHSKTDLNDRGRAIIDIFRVADDKIVEHWDVIQQIPETSANENTMF